MKEWLKDQLPAIVVIIILVTLLLVTGCSSKPEPAVKVVVQKVFVPKMISCVDKQDAPEYNLIVKTKINRTDSEVTKIKKLLTREKEHQQYVNLVQPLLKVCSEGETNANK